MDMPTNLKIFVCRDDEVLGYYFNGEYFGKMACDCALNGGFVSVGKLDSEGNHIATHSGSENIIGRLEGEKVLFDGDEREYILKSEIVS